MSATSSEATTTMERSAVQHALAAERARASRFRHALSSTTDKTLRRRCSRAFDASVGRAAKLALELVDMGQAVPMTDACAEFDGRVLEAMDRAIGHRAAVVRAASAPGRHRVA